MRRSVENHACKELGLISVQDKQKENNRISCSSFSRKKVQEFDDPGKYNARLFHYSGFQHLENCEENSAEVPSTQAYAVPCEEDPDKDERKRTPSLEQAQMLFFSLLVRASLARAWLVEPPGRHLLKSIEVQHPSEKSREKPWMTSPQHGDLRALGSRARSAPKVFPGLLRGKMDREQRLTSQLMA